MYEDFPFDEAPDWGLTTTLKEEMVEQKMGDGYNVSRPKGINYLRESWNPSWSFLDPPVAREMYSWLKARYKLKAFSWTHPETFQVHKVKCVKLTYITADVGLSSINATFEEDFNL